jgi:hypothetical protein
VYSHADFSRVLSGTAFAVMLDDGKLVLATAKQPGICSSFSAIIIVDKVTAPM